MISRHLKKNDKTIEEMELNIKKRSSICRIFLLKLTRAGSTINESDVQWITVYAVQAHATLIQHFAKEEKVLFPMAENILSVDEKEELQRLLQAYPYR